MPGCSRAPGIRTWPPRPYLLLLRLEDERLLLPLPLALARSLWALLFWLLARAPLLAAWAREEDGREEDEEEEEELRDAIAVSFKVAADAPCAKPAVNLGADSQVAVGHRSASV